jgi:hypothetical protein
MKFRTSILIFAISLMAISPCFVLAASPEQADKNDRLHIIYTSHTSKTTSVYLISALEKISGSEGAIKIKKQTLFLV